MTTAELAIVLAIIGLALCGLGYGIAWVGAVGCYGLAALCFAWVVVLIGAARRIERDG